MTTPPAGWYDDPRDLDAQRYWDGHKWTPHRRYRPGLEPQPPSQQPPGAPERRFGGLPGPWIVIAGALGFLALAVAFAVVLVGLHDRASSPPSPSTAVPPVSSSPSAPVSPSTSSGSTSSGSTSSGSTSSGSTESPSYQQGYEDGKNSLAPSISADLDSNDFMLLQPN